MSQTEDGYVLVHAPYGRDAVLICRFLAEAGISTSVCATIDDLCSAVHEGAGSALISDQSLTRENVAALAAALNTQPPWSDFPLIITTSGGEPTEESPHRFDILWPLGNLSLLERPVRSRTLVSAVRSALRARQRQYQLRDIYVEREKLVRELARSNDELAQFSYVVSHDLQAPIRAVMTFSELLANHIGKKPDPTAERFIATIQNGAATMETLIRTLLDYATIGREQVQLRNVAMGDLADQVVTLLQPTIEELGAEVNYGDLPSVDCDPVLLEQLLQNLIANALKYCPTTVAPRIHISAKEASDKWTISVMDNGPGIDPQYHTSIFQPLNRLHGKEIPGTGMGLAVCKKVVERHGGEIWVESEIGKGATFCFTLRKPAAELKASTPSSERKGRAPNRTPESTASPSISARVGGITTSAGL